MNFKQLLIDKLPLSTKTVSIRQFKKSDITDKYIGWLNDIEVVRYSNQRFVQHTKESSCQFYQNINNSDSVFLLIEDDSNAAIGTMTVHFNTNHATADVGILLGEKRIWGHGMGKSAWKLVINALEGISELRKITAGTLACNASMLALVESTGMVADGVRKQQALIEGEAVDIHYFALFNND